MAAYDQVAEQYNTTFPNVWTLHSEGYTYFNIIGNLSGKSVLDLGCGPGFYSRKFKHKGATTVVGVDISENMLELARHQEAKEALGIEYIHCDVGELGEIGSFDLVVASYLLCNAQTKEQLLKMCQTIYANLKPGGRFVSINNNSEQPPQSYSICEKYGFTKGISQPLQDGVPITIIFSVNGRQINFDNYYLSQATHEWAFRSAGFKEIRWYSTMVSPEGLEEFGKEFWQELLDYQPMVGIECVK